MFGYWFLCFLTLTLDWGGCYPTGPPAYYSVCNNMMPSPLSPHRQQLGNGSYDISTNATLSNGTGYFNYTAGETYSVTVLTKVEGYSFKGFLIQAWDPSDTRIGTFRPTNSSAQKLLDCSSINEAIPSAGTISHAVRNTNKEQTVLWTAPSAEKGLVDFRFTLVRSYIEFYGPLSAASSDGSIKHDRPPLPENVAPPERDPEDYRIRAKIPMGCNDTKCSMFVGIDTNIGNHSYLDIYLDGKAEAWAAVGFAKTPHMKNAVVVACNYNPNLEVLEALDTYNLPNKKVNVLQSVQRNYLHKGTYIDGRITCTIAREVSAGGGIDDIDLKTQLYLLFGVGQDRAAQSLRQHKLNLMNIPQVSQEPINPSSGVGNFGADNIIPPALTRAHGILMWIAWPVLACTGIFFAMWMREALPNGKWFQVHRALMLASLIVGLVGFASIFAAQYRKKGMVDFADISFSVYHFSFGIIAMAILVINPLISLIRCNPESKMRWIYNLIHGYGLGLLGQTLAVVNVGLGTLVYDYAVGSTVKLYWLYIAFIIVFIMINAGFTIAYFWKNRSKDLDSEKVSLFINTSVQEKSNRPQSSFIWGVLIGYYVFIAALTVFWIFEIAL